MGSLLLVKSASAATYYVDNTVADVHSASATCDYATYNPTTFSTSTGSDCVYATVDDVKANTAFLPGDAILFRKGQTWRARLNTTANGSLLHPITYSAYGNGKIYFIDNF